MRVAVSRDRSAFRVFVVEDDNAVREGLRAVLGGEGYDVRCYPDALEFLASAIPTNADVVVLDVGLPDLFGDGVAALLGEAGLRPRIIVISGLRRGAYEAAVRRIAPEAAFRKPLNLRALLRRLETAQPYEALRT